MSSFLPVQTHPAADTEVKTKIVCSPEVFKALLSQYGKVFRLEHLVYDADKGSAILTWIPQKPIMLLEKKGEK